MTPLREQAPKPLYHPNPHSVRVTITRGHKHKIFTFYLQHIFFVFMSFGRLFTALR